MLRIAKEYYLDSDSCNFTLYERKISQGEKNKGEEYFKALGYYGSIKNLYEAIIQREVSDDLGLIENMNKIINLMEEIKDGLSNITPKEYNLEKGE